MEKNLWPRIPKKESTKSGFDIDQVIDTIVEGAVKFKELEKELLTGEKSLKIVILPRSTQKTNDLEVSTLADFSVSTHEQGHHINHTLAGDKNLHRIIDEVFADYLAAAPIDNPRIGEFFAKSSGVISERLKNSSKFEES